MSKTPPTDLLEILYRALEDPNGSVIATNDAERLRQRLYALRKDNPAFLPLHFVLSPFTPSTELWIMHKGARDGGPS